MAVKKSELYSMLWEACNKLRGGVEPSRYKDYVLILLFFKYVSDRYKGQPFAEFTISPGASFDDLIQAKGTSDVGERTDIIIQKFLEDNKLQGSLPDVSFNNRDELGTGKELVDKVTGLIAVFENPAIDFKNNRASGDDIIGDAYEYFMMKFAQASGKSKGQFYTPSEVSRIIARLIGIGEIQQKPGKKWTIYDPAAGSGSLLIRAADEAPVDENGNSIVTIFAQEKYPDTAGLAKMNFVLHHKGTAEIKHGSTLSSPQYTDEFGGLRRFDFIVMNPPFSDKSWTDGIKPASDTYKRFELGIPPEKNGDFAWFLHVLKSLDRNGKAGIIMPLGVLFRGNVEEDIRREILERHLIKGVVGLPQNLFYGTGIPACIVIIDKEDADTREELFLIDASRGFKKDGSRNRLREQDIEKIVRTFLQREEIEGYSCRVKYSDILNYATNDGNLNITRYVQRIDKSLPQNIAAHLQGGIPGADIDSMKKLWSISPSLKHTIFTVADAEHDTYHLAMEPSEIQATISEDAYIQSVVQMEMETIFSQWSASVKNILLGVQEDTSPKELIRTVSGILLAAYAQAQLLDNYDVYDCLLNYWNAKLQDDVYILKASGYEAGQEIEYTYVQKKTTNANGDTVYIDTGKVKSFDGVLIPREIIETVYFPAELAAINALEEQLSQLDYELDEMREEESGDDGLLREVLNDAGDGIPKAKLAERIKILDGKKISPILDAMTQMVALFEEGRTKEMEVLVREVPELEELDIRNKNGKFGRTRLTAALKAAADSAVVPEIYKDEYEALLAYAVKSVERNKTDKALREARKVLDDKVVEKYSELTVDEIKHLLFDMKWMAKMEADIRDEIEQILNDLSSKVLLMAKRYEHTLGEIEERTAKSRAAVMAALERMGYK